MKTKIKQALISVSDKRGIVDFARTLAEKWNVKIISTGGTATQIREAGIEVTDVSAVTKFPEMLDGRVKSMHPHIAAAILADRRQDGHMAQLAAAGIEPIDLIVVNLYPFAATIAKPGVTLDDAIENIDIGGPTLIRAAAKNFEGVGVVVGPERYAEVLAELDKGEGSLGREFRFNLAVEAFRHTADYDETIYEYLEKREEFPNLLKLVFSKVQDLRYGENPHQRAAYYRDENAPVSSLAGAQKLHGKELSYNNILDLDSAWALAKEFKQPAVVVIKHNNPCGVALADDVTEAYQRAYGADSVSAFGGVVAFNREVEAPVAEKMASVFLEAVVAPAFQEPALEILTKKKDIRLLDINSQGNGETSWDLRKVDGGLLIQETDGIAEKKDSMQVATEKAPTEEQWLDLLFAWKCAKHVKSNAIVLAKGQQTVGIGAGQMSRVDAVDLAVKKAGDKVAGAVLASDAFFPFRDAVDAAAKAGVKAIIEPGGSLRDEEVIAAANEHGLAMVFTGKRHFRH